MKTTLRDIAKATGVSPTTVSLVLCDKGNISAETRELVRRTAAELDYGRTRGRAERKPGRTLGLLLVIDPPLSYLFSFIAPIIASLERRVAEEGFGIVLIPIGLDSSDAEICSKVVGAQVEAVASLHYGNINAFIRLEDDDIPVVVVMNNQHQDRYYSVCSDDFHGAYEGTRHLIGLGHRDLAYVGCERFNLGALSQDRFIGFTKALDEAKLDFNPARRLETDAQGLEDLREKLGRMFQDRRGPTAIFALDDELALRTAVVLGELALRVPQDVSIIAPGDVLDYSKPYTPRITTMRINTDLIGSTTGELLLNRVKRAKEKLYVLKVNQELVDRGSCAPPR